MFESRSRHAFVAQREEQLPGTQQAACSNHAEGTSFLDHAPVAQHGRRRLAQNEHSAGSNPAWRTILQNKSCSSFFLPLSAFASNDCIGTLLRATRR